MINLQKGQTQTVYFTGTEKAILTAPYFLFVFTHRALHNEVKLVATNTSTTERYDKFQLVVNSKFADADLGMYTYEVYEQASSTNVDPAGLNLVESGYMYLTDDGFTPDSYSEQSNTFKAYDGK